jgi:hypothetical protein
MVIYSSFPSLFLDDEEAYGKGAHSGTIALEHCAHGAS